MQGAIDRVEVTLPEYRWYFFETQPTSVDVKRQPFPDIFLSEDWRHDLANPRQRYQTFVSGFAEDMVCVGKTLPDEIITWMLDEICLDFDEVCALWHDSLRYTKIFNNFRPSGRHIVL